METNIGGDLALLPRSTKLTMIRDDAGASENEITYAQCRRYTASSTLRFSNPDTASTPMHTDVGPPDLPLGTRLLVALTKRIDGSTAAAGDVFEGALVQPGYDATGNVVAPKGAKIRGRILRIQQFFTPQPLSAFAIRLDSVEWNGRPQPLSIAPIRIGEARGVQSDSGGNAGIRTRRPIRPMPIENQLNSGAFMFAGKQPLVLEPGWTTIWKMAPRQRKQTDNVKVVPN